MSEKGHELSTNDEFLALITIRENYWLLKVILSFSEPVSEYEHVFRICV